MSADPGQQRPATTAPRPKAGRARRATWATRRHARDARNRAARAANGIHARRTGLQLRHIERLTGLQRDEIQLLKTRHPLTLAPSMIAAVVVTLLALLADTPLPLVAIAATIYVLASTRQRLRTATFLYEPSDRRRARRAAWLRGLSTAAAAITLGVLIASQPPSRERAALVLAAVVTVVVKLALYETNMQVAGNGKLWRLDGLVNTRNPSVALLTIESSEVQQSATGRVIGWGNLVLETKLQQDQAFHHFGPISNPHQYERDLNRLRGH